MRIKKLLVTILLMCCGFFCLSACSMEPVAQSIALNGYSEETPLQFHIGEFPYGNYTVSVTYDNGETEELPLTEDMISETDKLRFYQAGACEIAISYMGASTTVKINVERNVFSENVQLKDVTTVYSGETLIVEVEGDIPSGTQILYPQGNTFKNAGVYDMTAVLQCDGYVTKTLSARITIQKATYDVSGAQLYNQTFVYDKEAHGISVKGKVVETVGETVVHEPANVPNGVKVEYSITKILDGSGAQIPANQQQAVSSNRAIDAGTYKVCAKFKGDANNYFAIPDSIAYVTIERAAYDLSKVVFEGATYGYTGEEYSLTIAEGSKLPSDVEVSYEIKKLKSGDGQTLDTVYTQGNSAKDAGVYSVRAVFSVVGKNAANYTADPNAKEVYLTILRASYDEQIQNSHVNTQWFDFEENGTYTLLFEGNIPDGVKPSFTLKDEDGNVIEGKMEIQSAVESSKAVYKYVFTVETAGEYICVITFDHNNENYEDIDTQIETFIFIVSDN